MGLSGCYKFIKFLFLLINFLILVLGIVVIGLAAWMISDPTFYLSVTQEETKYYTGLYVFLAAGAILVFVSLLGCCGAGKESQCMLITFFCIVLIGIVAQVAAAWWSVANSGLLEEKVKDTIKMTVQKEYDGYNSRTMAFDAIQKGLKCCGATGPLDWQGSLYSKNAVMNNKEATGLGDAIGNVFSGLTLAAGGGNLQPFIIPQSCCNEPGQLCDLSRKVPITANINPVIHSTGCMDKVLAAIEDNQGIVIGVGFGVAALEVLALIFSLTLCCAVDRSDRYKA